MTNDNGLARTPHAPPRGDRLALQPRDFRELVQFAETIAGTSFAPTSKAAEIVAMIANGRELGLTAMQSLKAFHNIQGKPSMAADAMVAVVRASGLCEKWCVVETTATKCTITTKRRGESEASKTWTAEDAKRAELNTAMWRKFPAQMLRHRCASDLARQEYSDVLLGVYTPDELSDGEYDDVAPIVETAPQPPPAPKPYALDDYRAALSAAGCLHDAAQDYRLLSQRLHAEDATTAASEALAEWLDAGGYVLTATEQRACERGDYPREMLDLLDAVAECATGGDVVRWWGQTAHVVEALGAHAKAAKLIVARTYCARIGDTSKSPAKVFAAALAPKPPPTGTDSPSSARGDTATGDATPADATPSAEAQASIARVGDVSAYLARKSTFTEVQTAVVAHGAYVATLADAAVARLEALGEGGDDGNRTRLVAAWVSESASRAQRAERTAAKVQRAA
jgi:hypothetical protein